jgi:hypothetical protein
MIGETLLIPRMDRDTNERVCELVITSIAKHPQFWHGADAIIANGLLQPDDSRSYTGLDLVKASLVRPQLLPPKPDAATRVNDIHQTFGIPCRISPAQAASYIVTGAVLGIRRVELAAVEVANEMGITPPSRIARKERPKYFRKPSVDRLRYWLEAKSLTKFLNDHELLRTEVVHRIGIAASKAAARSRNQQAWAQGLAKATSPHHAQTAALAKRRGSAFGESNRA